MRVGEKGLARVQDIDLVASACMARQLYRAGMWRDKVGHVSAALARTVSVAALSRDCMWRDKGYLSRQ